MSSALWIATTGLAASTKQMDVIGHNIANSNTVGFKASDTHFASMLTSSLLASGRANYQLGQGVSVAAVTTQFQQGSFESTGNATDLAIDGAGFFVVKNTQANSLLFTRMGSFKIQRDGYLADGNGYRVQGRIYEEGVESKAIGDLNLKDLQVKPMPTSRFTFGGMLNFETPPGDSYHVRQTVYDSLGSTHLLDLQFKKGAQPGYWDVKSSLDNSRALSQTFAGIRFNQEGVLAGLLSASELSPVTVSGGGTATASILTPGALGSNSTNITLTRGADAATWTVTSHGGYDRMRVAQADAGKVMLDLYGKGEEAIRIDLQNPWVQGDSLTFRINTPEDIVKNVDFAFTPLTNGAVIGENGLLTWVLTGPEASSIMSLAGSSRTTSQWSNGFPPGDLTGINIDAKGVITGTFSNGQLQKVARVVLADFRSPTGLRKEGNYFLESSESGNWSEGIASTAGFGAIHANSLEISNTDMAKEFIKMITAQRAYQANARMITTTDQMQQELMNIKR
jgi:flagellar hook protein FlgE